MDEIDLQSWVDLAEKDLASAKHLLGLHPRPVEVICFLCQQASEKILKAILVKDEASIPRTHDLVALTQSMLPAYPHLDLLLPKCVRLSVYAVSTRYPYPGELPANAEELAIQDAAEIMKSPISLLPM